MPSLSWTELLWGVAGRCVLGATFAAIVFAVVWRMYQRRTGQRRLFLGFLYVAAGALCGATIGGVWGLQAGVTEV
ncbi:MAG: hypothetical protein ACRD96_09840, partial [Bryobacteraceae bacterium]